MGDVTQKDVILKHPFSYHAKKEGGGTEPAEAKLITIKAFSMKQMDKALPVKEIVMRSFSKMGKEANLSADDVEEAKEKGKEKSEADTIDDAKGMMSVISMYCEEGDLLKLHIHMKKLLTCGVANIDGDGATLNGSSIESMNPDDFDQLCGEYIGNFIT